MKPGKPTERMPGMCSEQMKMDVWDIMGVCMYVCVWLSGERKEAWEMGICGEERKKEKEGGTEGHILIFLLLICVKEGEVQFVS